MKLGQVVLVLLLIVVGLFLLGQAYSAFVGNGAAEPTPLENLIMARESRQRGGVNWPFMLLLMATVGTVAFLSIGDSMTKLLRAVKGLKSKPQQSSTLPNAPTINIEQLPPVTQAQLPARAQYPRQIELDSYE